MSTNNLGSNVAGRDVKITNKTSSKTSIVIGAVVIIAIIAVIFSISKNKNSIVGVWEYNGNAISFSDDGIISDSIVGNWGPGRYETSGNKVTISGTLSGAYVYTFKIDGNDMTFYDGDGNVEEEFERVS